MYRRLHWPLRKLEESLTSADCSGQNRSILSNWNLIGFIVDITYIWG